MLIYRCYFSFLIHLICFSSGNSSVRWPEGTYGLPRPEASCPHSDDFVWNTGSRIHQTEAGSHGSPGLHLASATPGTANRITQPFCMKTLRAGDGIWPSGRYCIYKKVLCPFGFQDGFIYWDDAAPWAWLGSTFQDKKGTVPDGVYDRNTKIYYCCRDDGHFTTPIVLPTEVPFYLIKKGEHCQQVEGMKVTEEWLFWMDEKTMTLSDKGGSAPAIRRQMYPLKFTQLYYCYYEKEGVKPANSLWILIASISSICAFGIVMVIVICLVKRVMYCHKSEDSEDGDDNIENASRERMLSSQSAATSPDVSHAGPPAEAEGLFGTGNIYNAPPQNEADKSVHPDLPPSYTDSIGVLGLPAATGGEAWYTASTQPRGAVQQSCAMEPLNLVQPPSYDDVLKEDGRTGDDVSSS